MNSACLIKFANSAGEASLILKSAKFSSASIYSSTCCIETKSNPIPVVETVDKNEVKSEPKAEIISQNKPEEKFEKKNIEVTEKRRN